MVGSQSIYHSKNGGAACAQAITSSVRAVISALSNLEIQFLEECKVQKIHSVI
jgi:hypothetical protein